MLQKLIMGTYTYLKIQKIMIDAVTMQKYWINEVGPNVVINLVHHCYEVSVR